MTGKRITATQRAYAHYLRTKSQASYSEIAKLCKMSKSSSQRICNEAIDKKQTDVMRKRTGRPRKLDTRNVRTLIRSLKTKRLREPNMSVRSLMVDCALDSTTCSRRTVSRILNESGYNFLQRRKKGILSDRDKEMRRKFGRKMQQRMRKNKKFWTKEVSFFIDGVSFIHKYNPLRTAMTTGNARVWRKKGEGLVHTGAGSKELAGGRRVHVMVAVAFGKGVILAVPYVKMDGPYFAKFIKDNFNLTFARAGPKYRRKRIFVMDNDPSQTSKAAMKALHSIEAELLKIPARSPDFNPIENIFHLVKRALREEAIKKSIECESFCEFQQRVLRAINNTPSDVIDKTISNLPERIAAMMKSRGCRTKY